jgi:serine protease
MTQDLRLVTWFTRGAAVLALTTLLACGGPSQPQPQPTDGTISGALSVVTTTASVPAPADASARGTPLSPAGPAAPATADLVPGEFIVRFEDGVRTSAITALDVAGVRLQAVRTLALPNAALFRAPVVDRDATLALVAELRARSDVRYADPNWILQPLRTPDDPRYPSQWHYPAIGLPAAWDLTTGSTSVVVAVGDNGILYAGDASPRTHPDLVGRVLSGYDFISDPAMAGDGDGRDPDPYDEGDDPHGTHVAGTIGAATDNGVGVAGVDWAARLLPVRMLGEGGGSLLDVVEGTLWAAGFTVPGVPENTTPAHVINLSLGGEAPCPGSLQEAFERIATSSTNAAIVVVAAGNANDDAGFTTPANCANVIVVGATEARGRRAPYSNHGSRIDVMAPGGDLTADRNADGQLDGVLSLARDANGDFGYGLAQGTSMAAPHVAGVISLMKSREPTLSLTQALAALTETALPLTATECGRPTGGECGAGLIDAAAALAAVVGDVIPTPGGGEIAYDPNPVDYGATIVERDIRLTNTGTATVGWSIEEYDLDAANPSFVPYGAVIVDVDEGTLAPGASTTIRLRIDRSKVTAPGAYRIYLVFLVDGVEQPLTLRFRTADEALAPSGRTLVFTVQELPSGELVLGGERWYPTFVPTYEVTAAPGRHTVFAWTDQNDSGVIDDGDFLGSHPTAVTVHADQAVRDVDVDVAPVLTVDEATARLIALLRAR